MTAALGLGTYRIAGEKLPAAVRRAAASPAAWIDTAPNYCDGRAHSLIAPVLLDHPELHVASKVGFVDPATARTAEAAEIIDAKQAAARHSIGAPYVRWQAKHNRDALGRLDLLFLHNPEATVWPAHLFRDMRAAFAVLEEQVHAGVIGAYGVATWSGFREDAFTVPVLDQLATEAAGTREHHLRTLQLPVSLVMADAFAQALDGGGPIAEAADLGWQVHASAPLHAGELRHLATPELAALIRPGASVTAACLSAVASCPGVSKVLVSTGSTEHWTDALAALSEEVPAETLRKVLDVLAAPD